jgi:CheY-like chemotaxis protein
MFRVLVVDDDPALRAMMVTILESEGYEVTQARNGQEAVACLERGWHPVVMLLDVMMPVMDGIAVCHWVNARMPLQERPHIIILSASMAPGTELPAAAAMLTKPFGIDAVLDLVGHFCQVDQAHPAAYAA